MQNWQKMLFLVLHIINEMFCFVLTKQDILRHHRGL